MKITKRRSGKYVRSVGIMIILITTVMFKSFGHPIESQANHSKNRTKALDTLVETIKSSPLAATEGLEQEIEQLLLPQHTIAEAYFDIGNHFYLQQAYDRSVHYYIKSAEKTDPIKHASFLCKVYLGQGNAHLLNWKNPEALDAYHQLLNTANLVNNLNFQIIAKSNIAIVLRRMNQLQKALQNCRELLGVLTATSFEDPLNHVNVLTIICAVHMDLQQYDSVMYYAKAGIKISKELNYQIGLLDLYTKTGIALYYKNDRDQALKQLALAEGIISSEQPSERSAQVMNVNYFLALYYFDIKKYNLAIDYLNKITTAIEESDQRKDRVVETYLLLAKCYYELGDTEQSITAFSKYDELVKLFEKNKDATVSKIHAAGTLELREKIRQLEVDQTRYSQAQVYAITGLILMTFLALVLSALYYLKQRSNKQKFNQLVLKVSELESRKDVLPIENREEATKAINIDDQKIDKVIKDLQKLEQKEYFLRLDCNLREMAKKVKTNSTYLSQIIKKHKGTNFNDYVTDLRIEYVLKRLKNDKKFRSYSIKSIALEVGYKSDNSFTKHFRARTQLNPSYYIKNIDKLQD